MNERILNILAEMDAYMSSGTMVEFLAVHKKMVRFNLTLTKAEMEQDISILDLSVRANNSIRRMGYRTVGSLISAIAAGPLESSKSRLLKFRSLGKKTADEILLSLMYYQFQIRSGEDRRRYVSEIVALNTEVA